MKKILSVILMSCLLIGCCGCSMIAALKGDTAEREQYLRMTTEELKALSDEELFNALHVRTEEYANTSWDLGEGAGRLPEPQKVFYVVSSFYTELENGGLCRFFVSGTRNLTPQVSESLAALGAVMHQTLFDRFLRDNKLAADRLGFFVINDEREFAEKRAQYPFDNFDIPYGKLPSLRDMLLAYARAHIAEY